MAKMVLKKTTVGFAVVIVLLMGACIGLLVALLKSQQSSDAGQQPTTRPPRPDYNVFRLPKHILPVHYDLWLRPEIGDHVAAFTGRVTIRVKATTPTPYFSVHAASTLVIEETRVKTADGMDLNMTSDSPINYPENELYVLEMMKEVPMGEYLLSFKFRGILNGSIVGFYKSTYIEPATGVTKYLATSKFQPTYARMAFPCFDEPTFKSKFTVTLEHQKEYKTILSNMPVEKTMEVAGNWTETKFKESVEMVTYLVCFIVSDFEYKSDSFNSNGINKEFRVYASPHQVNNTAYALDVGVKVIDYYANYFNISYPLPKQDMIAIPDFSSGAMEHWGLITYRETNLLYNEKESSIQSKQRVSEVVAHELAHMWFGNLVTMEWWDNLWLNEGFASYMEYKAVNHINEEWKMLDQFLTTDLQPVMLLDSTTTSHPIIQQVNNTDEITEIFDTISYNKGAAVLRMLESFVGEEKFQTGISNYLKKYEYKTAKTEDLWEEMTAVMDNMHNISNIMDTWTKQMGFPYITITKDRDNPSNFTAKQMRFLINSEMDYDNSSSEFGYIWKVPLSYVTSSGKQGIYWLDNAESTFSVDSTRAEDNWIKFNRHQTGYYLVNYQKEEWNKFIDILNTNHTALTPADRANLIFDAFQLAENGILDYEIPLQLVNYLEKESELVPWETAHNCFLRLGLLLQNVKYDFKFYVQKLIGNMYTKLGWNDGLRSHTDGLLQSTIVGLACESGNNDCIQKSLSYLEEWDQKTVPINLKRIVLRYGMANSSNKTVWDIFWNKYMTEQSAQERLTLLYGLAHTHQTTMINKLLEFANDVTKIRSQDFFSVLTYIAGNPVGRPIVWDFVTKNWKNLVDRFTTNNRYLGRAVKSICDYFTTEEELESMEKFFKENEDAGAGAMARRQALQNVRNNIRWLKMNKDSVVKSLGMPWRNHRLTRSVVPLHYDLLLHPDLETNQFSGHVTIDVEVLENQDFLIVHSNKIEVTESVVTEISSNEKLSSQQEPFWIEENQFFVIPLKQAAERGKKYALHYEFIGSLNGLVGFYKSSYVIHKGDGTSETRHLATSQFQSTYARQAFPCFDEPSFKSTFDITLVHPENMIAISNMPIMTTGAVHDEDKNLITTRFKTSEKMVTYLVCVIVCDFEKLSGKTKNGVEVQVFAAPDKVHQTAYALNVAIQTLEFFEDYFDIKYPLPKLDMIAIPDFQAGAMENWGLVTYRETNLLYEEGETPAYNQLRIAAVIGHELAHMWFGNLVTMKWWNDLWLNEGFASYIEYKSMHQVNATWDMDAQFFLEDMSRVVVKDATKESHPIVQEVNNTNQIAELFDAISYSKGATVLRMLEFFMGSDSFKNGISEYLKKYEFGNSETSNLWEELQNHVSPTVSKNDVLEKINIAEIMDSWTRQMGYPCVSVSRKSDQTFTVSQERFLLDSKDAETKNSPFGYVWKIPLSFKTEENLSEVKVVWLNSGTQELAIPLANKSSWVKFNVDHKGYYIVHYKDEWDSIVALLNKNHVALTPADRSNLISDAFLLSRGGLLDYNVSLTLSKYLKKEDHFVPWQTASSALTYIADLLFSTTAENKIKKYLDNLTVNKVKSLYWEDNGDHLTKRLRAMLIGLSCKSGNRDCLNNAGKEFELWLNGKYTIPSNLRSTIYCYGMKEIGNETIWNQVWQKYLDESSPQEKVTLLRALSCVKSEQLLKTYVEEHAWDEKNVRKQDYVSVLSYVASNPVGLNFVWNYYRNNWSQLVQKFTITNTFLGSIAKSIANHFKTDIQLQEMKEFFEKEKEAGAGEMARKEALKTVESNIKWLQSYQTKVENWLDDQNQLHHNIRLPRHIVPLHYDVELQPDLDEGTFNGTVCITVQLTKPTQQFVVHIRNLTVTKTSVTHEGNELPHETPFYYEKNEYWVINMREQVQTSENIRLYFEFEGEMKNKLRGFYRSTYKNANDELRHIATSQFQSTSAREAFPSFDEPSFKSTFNISLIHPKDYIALSNMPPEEGKENLPLNYGRDLLKTTFQKTSKPMVTYLVCVIICDFEHTMIEDVGTNNIMLRVFVSPDNVKMTTYSLDAGKRILEFLEGYFNIPYPLPKLDMIGIPDFSAGAMENWGLITYREIYLCFDKEETPPSTQFSMFMIIAHEIAHMWFGNLVTMSWWDDLWLNEGFATYMAYKVTATLNPDWNGEGFFLSREMNRAAKKDATKNSNPIVRTIEHPHDIAAAFDSVTYGKGGSILRMLENYITEEKMQSGLRNYLNKYEDQNAVTDELWEELEKVSNADVKGLMNTWTRQMGYPVINIDVSTSRKTVTLRQKRFLLNPKSTVQDHHVSPYWYNWKIPLNNLNLETNAVESYLITKVEEEFQLQDTTNLFKWNHNQMGYYLINYDENSWTGLALKLKEDNSKLSALDRSNLINDAFMLAKSGDLGYGLALELTKYLKSENDYIVWSTASSDFLEILHLMDEYPQLKEYLKELTKDNMNKLTWTDNPNETIPQRLLRSTIISLACRADNKECLTQASDLLEDFVTSSNKPPAALQSLVYRYGLSEKNELWDKMWEIYENEKSAQERNDLLYGLAFTNTEENLNKYLMKAENESLVRNQDYSLVMSSISATPLGLQVAWEYIKTNYNKLLERFGIIDSKLGGFIQTVCSKFTNEIRVDEMRDLFKKYPDAGAGAENRRAALEAVENNIQWKKNYEQTVRDWFEKQQRVTRA